MHKANYKFQLFQNPHVNYILLLLYMIFPYIVVINKFYVILLLIKIKNILMHKKRLIC